MDAYDHIVAALSLTEQGNGFRSADGARLRLRLDDDGSYVTLYEISVTPSGTGLGTRAVEALLDYCDEHALGLEVNDVRNREFFARFDGLSDGGDGNFYLS